MKKSLLLHKRFSLFVVGLALSMLPTITTAQPVPCSANWWARCCRCETACIVVDPLPSFGFCRSCTLLCAGCRKDLGDLNTALSDLQQLNQALYARYRARQQSSIEHNNKMIDAMVDTYGEESGGWTKPSTWNLNGFNSSFGKFTTAGGSVVTAFGGGFGYNMLFNVLSTLQSNSSAEYLGNTSSTLLDLLTADGIVKLYTADVNLNTSALNLYNAIKNGQPIDPAMNQYLKDVQSLDRTRKVNKGAGIFSNLADVFEFLKSGYGLISDLAEIYDQYQAREANEKERERLQEEIIKNVDLMVCIKETQDSLKSGPLGFRKNGKVKAFFLGGLVFSFPLYEMQNKTSIHFKTNEASADDYFWQIDSIKLKSAISQLTQQRAILQTMANVFMDEVIPPAIPWILNKWQVLKLSTQVKLLQRLKSALNKLLNNFKTVKNLTESITENVTGIILGYETNYADAGLRRIEPTDSNKVINWESSTNAKIKTEMGRVNMSFPAGVDWSIDFYTADDKFITNRSSFSKHPPLYDIAPGLYNLKLNHILIKNVAIEKGKEVKLSFGYLSLVTRNPWELYSASRKIYYTSGIKPVKFALPVGDYLLKFEGKDHRITIKEKVTVKFARPIGDMFEK